MNKKALLLVLPALLVLSACQAAPKAKQNNLFLEDTLAHEELFDANALNMNVRKTAAQENHDDVSVQPRAELNESSDPVVHPDDNDPTIGVQTLSQSAGHISFRFVAAVTFTNENIGSTVAKWTRTVSKADGTAYPMDTADYEVTTAYTSLSADGDPYTIEQFNGAHGNAGYTHFVVYTLRNVPVDSNDYYVSAYLTLSVNDSVTLTSKAIAINASNTHSFSYVPKDGEYFISGSFGGNTEYIEATAVRTTNNKAEFEYLDLNAGDTFVINEFYDTKLYVHGATECLEYDGNTKIKSCFEGDNGKIKVKASMGGSYGLYLSKTENRLYTEEGAPYGVHNGFYIKGDMNGWAAVDAYEMFNDRSDVAILHSVNLTADQQLKIWKQWNENNEEWFGWHDDKVSTDSTLFSWANGGNIKCNVTGTYDIILNSNYKVWINPVTA